MSSFLVGFSFRCGPLQSASPSEFSLIGFEANAQPKECPNLDDPCPFANTAPSSRHAGFGTELRQVDFMSRLSLQAACQWEAGVWRWLFSSET